MTLRDGPEMLPIWVKNKNKRFAKLIFISTEITVISKKESGQFEPKNNQNDRSWVEKIRSFW